MGNSTSSSKATEIAKERAYIRSLGDRFPLGDAELRKYVWCYQQVSARTPTPIESSDSLLLSLATWSVIYGDYNPYVKNLNESTSSVVDPMQSLRKLAEALNIVEQNILLSSFGKTLIRRALSLDELHRHSASSSMRHVNFPTQCMSSEEVHVWQSTYYSIESMAMHEGNNCALEDFLESLSVSCGRRGSRAALTKMFMLCCKEDSNKMANPSDVVCVAYCLTLAASYLKNVAISESNIDWTRFKPQKSEKDMKAVVDSLINSAKKQREGGGGGFCPNFDYSYSAAATNASVASDAVSLDEFLEWAETTVPMISSALPTFLHVLLSFFTPASTFKADNQEIRFPPGVTPLWMPTLTVETKDSSTSPASSSFVDPSTSLFDLFALSCTSLPLASGRWHMLFSSEANGLSCNRLMHSILGYAGPTLILIRAKNAHGTFGAYTFTPWSQESGAFYGNSDCFLFRLGPDPFAAYRPKGSGASSTSIDEFGNKTAANAEDETRNYQYFNPEARSKGYDGLAHGIGFGGSPERPRLYIDEILDGSCAKSDDLTFDNGPLLSCIAASDGAFEVEAIEAFGAGTAQQIEEALSARNGYRDEAAKRIRQAMKGAKGQFLEDMQAGLVGGKVFKHREQMRGRDGGCDMDKDDDANHT